MNRTIYTIVLVCLLGSTNLRAQHSGDRAFNDFFTFAWDVNIPMGDKYVDATSYAGGRLEYRKMLNNDHSSIGIDMTWNSYYNYQPYQTYHFNKSTDVTTDLYKYNYTLPLALTYDYYFPDNGGIFRPYIGLGLGATFSAPKLYFNIYEISFENWGFLVRPELGTMIKFHRYDDIGLLVSARYSYSTNQEDALNIKNLQALGFSLGVVWVY